MSKKRNTKDNKYSRVEELITNLKKKDLSKTSASGYKNILVDNRQGRKPYKAMFDLAYDKNRLRLTLGSFNTVEEAQLARIKFIDSLK